LEALAEIDGTVCLFLFVFFFPKTTRESQNFLEALGKRKKGGKSVGISEASKSTA